MTPRAAQTAVASTETYGLPDTATHLIAKLRTMDPVLRASILGNQKAGSK